MHVLACMLSCWPCHAQQKATALATAAEPPQARQMRRFLARRGWSPTSGIPVRAQTSQKNTTAQATAQLAVHALSSGTTSAWTALGPTAVTSTNFGLVTGRVTSIALDPNDSTGNHVYIGTTGGGVWESSNAATSSASSVVFTALTDSLSALDSATDASISIGAVTVQPGNADVVLAGTGDTNDLSSSYYGAGILRSADGGNTWILIPKTKDYEDSLGISDFSFLGEGFAGFAWSTSNTALVVAAVSDAYEASLVNAVQTGNSSRGLYYSPDAGVTWHLATIEDSSSAVVQGPLMTIAGTDGNAVTSVVWNPIRKMFFAAVRYHGYYQSSDGITWTRLSSQPGSSLTTTLCPTNSGTTGSTGCPIYRGTLAVNPTTGDTFAWTVNSASVDQGLWRDSCSLSSGSCSSSTVSFATQINTSLLESTVNGNSAGIVDGLYTLALAAVPYEQDTILLAGDDDVWRCSLASGCATNWRNTTNTSTCMTAMVGPYQHALTFNASNTEEILIGNDSGLWRSMDQIGQSGTTCISADASHYQNLNGSLGSLADVESISPVLTSPYVMMAGLGVNGVAGVKETAVTTNWPQILSGYGGPVAVDSTNTDKWYVNDAEAGVSIYLCNESTACTASDFGTSPVVDSADVSGDGVNLSAPATFMVDPLSDSDLLIATCRVWRGPASGSGWSSSNAISRILDTSSSTSTCYGDGQIRTMAAMQISSTTEVIYLGMYGSLNGGGNLGGHVLTAIFNTTASSNPTWTDITNAVTNNSKVMNYYGYDISSIYIDPHDTTGNTVYVTVEGFKTTDGTDVQTLYRSTNGGTTWTSIVANLPISPANAVVVDPQDAGTVYVATDEGVYYTSDLSSCITAPYECWTALGSGLPMAPVVALSAAPTTASNQVLVAGTFGRGLWETDLISADETLTSVSVVPTSLDFGNEPYGSTSAARTVTLTNSGSKVLSPTAIEMSSTDFLESDNCTSETTAVNATCSISVSFRPGSVGAITGSMVVKLNVSGGQISVPLSGTGTVAGTMSLSPPTLSFGSEVVGGTSSTLQVTATNSSSTTAVAISSVSISSTQFAFYSDTCSGTTLNASSSCQLEIEFSPTTTGALTGVLTMADTAGTQTVDLSGTGVSAASDTLSATSLTFAATAVGSLSSAQTITLTNNGGVPLTSIALSLNTTQYEESNTCTAILAAGASCSITVTFAPTQIGTISGTLSVSDVLQTQTVSLSGTAVKAATISVSPTYMTFSNTMVGVTSSPQTLTVTNNGAVSMASVGFQITGVAAASYSLENNTCGATLAAGASCTVQVVFTPTDSGVIAATLSVSSATTGVTPVAVPLNGSAILTNALTVIPSSITFSPGSGVGVGLTSTATTLTFSNTSAYSIAAPSLSISSPFAIAKNNCASTLAAVSSCTVTVTFTPTSVGSYSGTMIATSSTVTDPADVSLSGVGFDFAASLSGSSTQTVVPGTTATYNIAFNTLSNVTGTYTYTFACGTLPTGTACSFASASVTTAAGTSGQVALSITTTSSTANARKPASSSPWLLRTLPLLCGLLMLPLGWRARRRLVAMLGLLGILTGIATSCASAGIASSKGTTSTGTYTIPVTVTSIGVSHSVSVTLTVD
ncbi:choice-of-anchor D domain-containing protein [Telmatobacter bradus]|uniref:choice-of-anchor D domain-containing protein n=1 Tax=Telmatobacter bradus TaxID=474953 RepID=UPI003B4279E4